jgi:hypothetical protein
VEVEEVVNAQDDEVKTLNGGNVVDGNAVGSDSELDLSENETENKTEELVEGFDETNITQQQIDHVFATLLNLHWRDKDEFKMPTTALNHISTNDVKRIFPVMLKLSNDLELSISRSTGALDSLTNEEKKNFLFHVIAKGESMYYQSIADPDFCIYMLDQYQPLFTMMRNKINKFCYRAD